jgi:hypothetical protein
MKFRKLETYQMFSTHLPEKIHFKVSTLAIQTKSYLLLRKLHLFLFQQTRIFHQPNMPTSA